MILTVAISINTDIVDDPSPADFVAALNAAIEQATHEAALAARKTFRAAIPVITAGLTEDEPLREWHKVMADLDTASADRPRVKKGASTDERKADQNRERQIRWRERQRALKARFVAEDDKKLKEWVKTEQGQQWLNFTKRGNTWWRRLSGLGNGKLQHRRVRPFVEKR